METTISLDPDISEWLESMRPGQTQASLYTRAVENHLDEVLATLGQIGFEKRSGRKRLVRKIDSLTWERLAEAAVSSDVRRPALLRACLRREMRSSRISRKEE